MQAFAKTWRRVDRGTPPLAFSRLVSNRRAGIFATGPVNHGAVFLKPKHLIYAVTAMQGEGYTADQSPFRANRGWRMNAECTSRGRHR
jgi:hypothetical protein